MGTHPTSKMGPKGKNKMKLTFALVVVLFAAATLADECQIYRGAVEKLAVEISSRQPRPESLSAPDGVCFEWTALHFFSHLLHLGFHGLLGVILLLIVHSVPL